MSNKEIVKAIIGAIYDEYNDDFQEEIFGRPVKELITESLLEKFAETGGVPDELDVWEKYENICIDYRKDLVSFNANLIESSEFGLEFVNDKGTQYGVMVACQSGSVYKVALFDQRGIFSHFSSNDPVAVAKHLSEYRITKQNPDQKFEIFCESDSFINNTAKFMDINKVAMFRPKI